MSPSSQVVPAKFSKGRSSPSAVAKFQDRCVWFPSLRQNQVVWLPAAAKPQVRFLDCAKRGNQTAWFWNLGGRRKTTLPGCPGRVVNSHGRDDRICTSGVRRNCPVGSSEANLRAGSNPRDAKRPCRVALAGSLTVMVGMTGFEPAASASRTQRSTKLSHIPKCALADSERYDTTYADADKRKLANYS